MPFVGEEIGIELLTGAAVEEVVMVEETDAEALMDIEDVETPVLIGASMLELLPVPIGALLLEGQKPLSQELYCTVSFAAQLCAMQPATASLVGWRQSAFFDTTWFWAKHAPQQDGKLPPGVCGTPVPDGRDPVPIGPTRTETDAELEVGTMALLGVGSAGALEADAILLELIPPVACGAVPFAQYVCTQPWYPAAAVLLQAEEMQESTSGPRGG